jgi:copper transport protein
VHGRVHRLTRWLGLASLALWACLFAATPVWAHASLVASEPRDGAVVAEAPREFVLTFNEQVQPAVVRLFDPAGGNALITSFKVLGSKLVITPPHELVQGTHALSWRVISADGHPVGGTVIFSVGAPGGIGFSIEGASDPALRAAIWLARVALFIGFFIGIGGSLYGVSIGAGSPLPSTARTAIAAALLLALVAAPISVGLQGLDTLARPLSDLGSADVWRTGYATTYGTSATVGFAALLAALASLWTERRVIRTALAAAALVMLCTSFLVSGHASTAEPYLVSRSALLVHVAGLAVWLGALLPLMVSLRSKAPDAGTALDRFSRTIALPLAGLIVGGIVLSVIQLEHLDALWTTDYGRVLCCKIIALLALFGLAVANRFVLTPAWRAGDADAPRRFSLTIGAELLVALLILGIVACWRFTPPPRSLAAGLNEPLFTHVHIGRAMADVTMTRGPTGRWRIDMMFMTADFQPLDAQEVEVILSNSGVGIEPITRSAKKTQDGTWQVDDVIIPVPGIWGVDMDVLVGDFERIDLQGQFEIKR